MAVFKNSEIQKELGPSDTACQGFPYCRGCSPHYLHPCEISFPLKCQPSPWKPPSHLEFCAPFFFKMNLSSKLFLRGDELISVLWEYFSSNTVENCTGIKLCQIDKYYETPLECLRLLSYKMS